MSKENAKAPIPVKATIIQRTGLDFVNATEGCLSSSINFTELAFLNITVEDHWEIMDCETPLPAVYKCCTMPANATIAPEPAVEPSF